jgi:2-oxoglutarate ferredoxin oxidoreductase subunit beta
VTYLAKPRLHHPDLPKNKLGYTHRDYEGTVSTLCAGCGHDSISGAIIQAFFELDVPPHRVAKLSRSAARRRPRPASQARTASTACTGPHTVGADRRQPRQPRLIYFGVSGDGDPRRRSGSGSSRT